MNTEKKQSDYEELMQYLEEAQAYETALILFEWDEETLAPEKAGSRTARMQGVLSSWHGPAVRWVTSPKRRLGVTSDVPTR